MKLPPYAAYVIEISIVFVGLCRLLVGPAVEFSSYSFNPSLLLVFLIPIRLCVPLFIDGKVPSLIGLKVSEQSDKETGFFFGMGVFIFLMVVIYT